MSLRAFLELHADKIALAVFLAVSIGGVVGFRRRTTPLANFVSCVGSALLGAAGVIIAVHHGYDALAHIAIIGIAAGTLGYAAIGLLMKLADLLEARSDSLAKRVLDKYLPPDGKEDK
jgi:hypothetical protein